MNSGNLKFRISLEKYQYIGQDPSTGEELRDWVKLYDAWADIRHLSGLESIKAAAPTSTVKASIRLRYRPGINASMRIRHGETIYEIEAVLPGKHRYNKYIDLICTTMGNAS